MKSICCWLLLASLIGLFQAEKSEPKLIFVQEVFRHGARNPFNSTGIGDEYVQLEHREGELTKQGKSMHFVLGQLMKKTYWDQLFGQDPFEPNNFYIRSTDVNRTIESAMSHLAGLL